MLGHFPLGRLDAATLILVNATTSPRIEPARGGSIGRLAAGVAAYATVAMNRGWIPSELIGSRR